MYFIGIVECPVLRWVERLVDFSIAWSLQSATFDGYYLQPAIQPNMLLYLLAHYFGGVRANACAVVSTFVAAC